MKVVLIRKDGTVDWTDLAIDPLNAPATIVATDMKAEIKTEPEPKVVYKRLSVQRTETYTGVYFEE